jgi:hypothetical protein
VLVGAHPDNYREQLFKKTLQQCKVFFVFTTFVFDESSRFREDFILHATSRYSKTRGELKFPHCTQTHLQVLKTT